MKMLKSGFFDRSSVIVAKELLGKYLVRKIRGKEKAYRILETEACEGGKDKASHASRGQTVRNTPMFGKPGTIYVYFTYGMHWMLNIVCGKVGHPAAVLIRGVENCIGPGRLTKKLSIDKALNEKPLDKKTRLWIEEDNNFEFKKSMVVKTKRIGIDYAGAIWSKKLYRVVLKSK